MPETALQTLLDRRANFLAFVERRVGDRALAEDILQAAYLRALEHTSGLREEQSAAAWFFSVLRNAVIDHYRRRATESAAMDNWAGDLGLTPGVEPATPEAAAHNFICGCIEQVLPTLRPAYAEVLREVDLNEMPLIDFAERHQLTAGNAAVRAHRARAALRRELARFCGACSVHACLDCVCKTSSPGKPKRTTAIAIVAALLWIVAAAASAQSVMSANTLIQSIEQHGSSGTSIEPASTPIPMLSTTRSFLGPAWRLMLHANAFAADTQQQAASERGLASRGKDAFFSTNWIMPMAQRELGPHGRGGQLTLRTMLSFEPATVGRRNFPELFQQGETAYGKPIVDGQHPHDFFMEVAALYDLPLSHNTLLSLYAAPIGDPAIGPAAYPHRYTASEDPIAALGHHQEDSTHIAFSVVTGGLTYRWARVELSGFHGAEPDEARWHFQPSPNGLAIDSVATRLTVSPTPDLTGQYSIAHIHSPELLYPGEDQQRQTASAMYHHTFRSKAMPPMPSMKSTPARNNMAGMDMTSSQPTTAAAVKTRVLPAMHMVSEPTTDFAATLLWGRTRSLADNAKENSYLAEALLRFASTNYVWTRLENAGRSNELELTPGDPLPPGFVETPIGHVAATTLGYDHDIPLGRYILAAAGAQFTLYRTPPALRSIYGDTPTGEVLFIRFRLR